LTELVESDLEEEVRREGGGAVVGVALIEAGEVELIDKLGEESCRIVGRYLGIEAEPVGVGAIPGRSGAEGWSALVGRCGRCYHGRDLLVGGGSRAAVASALVNGVTPRGLSISSHPNLPVVSLQHCRWSRFFLPYRKGAVQPSGEVGGISDGRPDELLLPE
jgi:hypothetical protein